MPDPKGQVMGPYDEDSFLLQDLVQRNTKVVSVYRLNLTAAGNLWIQEGGYHFVIYGDDNSANQAINSTILVSAFINKSSNDGTNPFPAKHARGFSGPFGQIYFEWLAQSNAYANVIIYKAWDKPYIDGETPT